MVDWKQTAAGTLVAGAGIAVWYAGHRLGVPSEYTAPILVAMVGYVTLAMRSNLTPPPPPKVDEAHKLPLISYPEDKEERP